MQTLKKKAPKLLLCVFFNLQAMNKFKSHVMNITILKFWHHYNSVISVSIF